MTQVFMRVGGQYSQLRCPTCGRVFCCGKHRMDHERRDHVAQVPVTAVIKRRFRSEPQRPLATINGASHAVAAIDAAGHKSRKRPRSAMSASQEPVIAASQQPATVASQQPVTAASQQLSTAASQQPVTAASQQPVTAASQQPVTAASQQLATAASQQPATAASLQPEETPVRHRAVAKARKAVFRALSTGLHTLQDTSPPALPERREDEQEEFGTPGQSTDASSPSFYQTPMQQTPAAKHEPPVNADTATALAAANSASHSAANSASHSASHSAAKSAAITNVRASNVSYSPASAIKGKKRFSSTPKGFFWSKVARRFRLALQAAKPKAEEIASPSVGYVDTAKYYGNIQPRRPISNEVLTPSLMARPSLENIRLAHEAAVKATNSSRINSVEHNS